MLLSMLSRQVIVQRGFVQIAIEAKRTIPQAGRGWAESKLCGCPIFTSPATLNESLKVLFRKLAGTHDETFL